MVEWIVLVFVPEPLNWDLSSVRSLFCLGQCFLNFSSPWPIFNLNIYHGPHLHLRPRSSLKFSPVFGPKSGEDQQPKKNRVSTFLQPNIQSPKLLCGPPQNAPMAHRLKTNGLGRYGKCDHRNLFELLIPKKQLNVES